MNRRDWLLAAGALVCTPLSSAQQPPAVARVGVLAGVGDLAFRETFAGALRELGWVEGKNLVIDWRPAPKQDEVPALARDMVLQKPHVIVTGGPRTTLAVAGVTREVPIVFIAVGNPVKLGVVRSLTQPGGNVTGFQTVPSPGYPGKLLQMLKEAAPRTSHVGVLHVPANSMHLGFVENATEAARGIGLSVVPLAVREAKDIEPAFELARRAGVNALLTPGDILFSANRERIAALALKQRLPSMFMFSYYAEAGGLLAYAVSVSSFYRNAARQADKILRGAQPKDLPVEMADRYDFVINLKTAKQLGLAISDSLRLQATQLIE